MASLYLFPTLLADVDWKESLPSGNIEKILSCKHFIVEELRTARRMLRKIGYSLDFEQVELITLNEHTKDEEIDSMLEAIEVKKEDVFLMSEAGLPCVADPGAKVVSLAQQKNIDVRPLAGPSSVYLSLMASGFNGQNFAFNGYLPIKDEEKKKKLHLLEDRVYKENQTQIFIEAPYRNDKLLQTIVQTLKADTMLCIASDICGKNQTIKSKTIKQWKNLTDFSIGKQNTIFLLYHA